jgi:type II secretion system protein C
MSALPLLRRDFRALACGAAAVSALWVGGCQRHAADRADTERPGVVEPHDAAADEVVARVNDQPITARELDAALRLNLFDLDQARYEIRARHLEQLVAERSKLSPEDIRVEIMLRAPEPPRIEVAVDEGRIRGDPEAPVTILEFLDYESSYCQRMQPTLHRILDEFREGVRLAVRDLPLAFHRHAVLAAQAAGCAGEQGAFWTFHDVLLQEQAQLAREDLDRYARRLDLDADRFSACLDSGRLASGVAADADAARQHGVSVAPTFFVNGLYLKGPQSFATLERFVLRELARLGSPRSGGNERADGLSLEDARASDLPLALVGTVVATDSHRSLAAIRRKGEQVAHVFQIGDSILKGVRLVEIRQSRVYVRHDGDVEFLPLREVPGASSSHAGSSAAEIVLTLERTRLSAELGNRRALEQSTELAPLDVEGRRLVKLREVPAGSLLDRLGLQPRDVLMRVDGEWIHDQRNPLWQALETQNEVTLVIMRRGLPRTFKYVIE